MIKTTLTNGTMDPDMAVAATQAQAMLWPHVAAQATEVSTVPTVTCPPDSSMVTGHRPRGPGFLLPLVAMWAMDIFKELGCGRAMDPVMVFGTSLHVTKALGGCTCHIDQHCPSCRVVIGQ